MDSTEADLESFRRQWKEEVSARTRGKAPSPPAPAATSTIAPRRSQASSSQASQPKSTAPSFKGHAQQAIHEDDDEVEPHKYEELGEKKHGRTLDDNGPPSSSQEPRSALEHYEKAVEKESQGSLGDSVNLYRKAFRLDSNVHQIYKNKHFPASSFPAPKPKSQDPNPSNAPATVPNTAHHSLQGLPTTIQSMIEDFSSLCIQGEPAPTDLSPTPPCPISTVPEEILADILSHLAVQDLASFVRLAQVCKRLAYLVTTEDQVWKRICMGPEYGFPAMHYSFACRIDGKPLGDDGEGGYLLGSDLPDLDAEDQDQDQEAPEPPTQAQITAQLVPSTYPNYRALFRRRPRIRFNGCYISTVNYTRPGASSPTSVSWNSPIHIVTYYRYLRFLRDGTCISLLTTSEPSDVVPYLHVEHMHKNHGNLPSAPMKDALLGRWKLSGPAVAGSQGEECEKEGMLSVETAGATPKYIYKMMLSLSNAGSKARNNKLAWQGHWSYNLVTDDWAEFMMRNYRAFYFSRVKSFGMAFGESAIKA